MTATFDMSSAAFRADPYPAYQELREQRPVLWDSNSWLLTRHADVLATLTDPRFSAARTSLADLPEPLQAEFAPYGDALSKMMLLVDPPDHTRLRGLVSQAFSAK